MNSEDIASQGSVVLETYSTTEKTQLPWFMLMFPQVMQKY